MMVSGVKAAAAAGVVAMGLLGLTACGGGASTSAPAAPAAASRSGVVTDPSFSATAFTKDPCTLLTAEEITEALGAPAAGEPSTSATGLKVCGWSKSGNTSIADLQLHYNSAPIAQAFKLGLDKHLLGPKDQLVPIGDGAVLKTGDADITVLVGGSTFELDGSYGKLSDDAVTALAKAAAARVG